MSYDTSSTTGDPAPQSVSYSVIVPTFNRAATIGRAIESVLSQDFENWELVIVDDGSTDDTAAVVRPLLSDRRIRYVAQSNAGVAAARNTGASTATGSMLTFLDSDDEVTASWLADFHRQVDLTGERVGFVSCGFRIAGRDCPPRWRDELSASPYNSLSGTFAVSKRVFDIIGGYDAQLRQSENWEMVLRALDSCQRASLKIAATPRCNLIVHRAKNRTQQRSRDLDRANAYLHLHDKYVTDGILHARRERFLVGAAVNFARSGQLADSRRWFYRNFRRYPSTSNLARIVCFEIPYVRNRLWNSRNLAIEITDN
ncbi:glycosyltransferase family 2 protein [Ilumatobacter nonamiensis]|uniref:glycosyltransferase family 2 protein n=1 Tax=Ilumatobacter nonamiensis TaxID=467093 RepID=UPI000688AE9F|nr:glycosyltransferase family A protein [Ilumatobacter nonamiensis]